MVPGLRQIVAPAEEPVTLTEARAHLRVTGSSEDALISSLIAAARERAEAICRRQFVTATFAMTLDAFPDEEVIELYQPPAQSIVSVAYIDEAGASQTLDPSVYQLDTYAEPARVVPAYDESWPDTRDQPNAVTVTYLAGYGAASAVPQTIKQAILVLVAEMFERRENLVPGAIVSAAHLTAERLLEPYRVVRF